MHKTQIPNDKINAFIKSRYGSEVEVTKINSGEYSQAMILKMDKKELILRFNSNNDLGFQKDKIIFDKYPNIKSPKILEVGKFEEDIFYALSQKLEGTSLRSMSSKQNSLLLQSLFENMNMIHSSEVLEEGWGNWDLTLKGQFRDWEERMDYYIEKDNWVDLSNKCTFLDLNIFEDLYKKYKSLVQYIPSKRYFLHGDFGRSNVFGNSTEITGVIDWSEAMYGDFLWDVCWIDFWSDKTDFVGEYYKFNKNNSFLGFNNFEERVALYRIVNGIHHMSFAAARNDKETYNSALKLLKRKV